MEQKSKRNIFSGNIARYFHMWGSLGGDESNTYCGGAIMYAHKMQMTAGGKHEECTGVQGDVMLNT